MRVKMIYDQGCTSYGEDALILQPPFFGVVDGVSGSYYPEDGPTLFNGKTGGQLASFTIGQSFAQALPESLLEEVLIIANQKLFNWNLAHDLPINESELLPSASFCVSRVVSGQPTEVIQGGDCLAVWQKKNGTIGSTPNQAFRHEKVLINDTKKWLKKFNGDRNKMWRKHLPFFNKARRQHVNTISGYSSINGQPDFFKFWQKYIFESGELALLILFSDGFVPFFWTKNPHHLAARVLGLYHSGELAGILRNTRNYENKTKKLSYEDHYEASALAIEF